MKFCFFFVLLLLNCFGFLKASDPNFDAQLLSVMRYVWNHMPDPFLKTVPATFDFLNYKEWSEECYAQDLAHFRPLPVDPNLSYPSPELYNDKSNYILRKAYNLARHYYMLEQAFENGQKFPNYFGCTVAHVAAWLNQSDALEFMITRIPWTKNARIQKFGTTPLHMAVLFDAKSCVKKLLEYEADLLMCDANGMSPIDLAISKGNAAIVKLFIERGGILSLKENGYDALANATLLATRWGFLNVAAYFHRFTKYAIYDPTTGANLLHLACKLSTPEVVQMLRESVPIRTSKHGFLPHFYAIIHANLDALYAFSEEEIRAVGTDGFNYLDAAIVSGEIDIVKKMIERYHPSKEQLICATYGSIIKGLHDVCAYLLTQNVSLLDTYRSIPLIGHIFNHHALNLSKWIDLCKNREWTLLNVNGRSLPDYAIETRNKELLEGLLLSGWNPKFTMANGMTAIEYTERCGMMELHEILSNFCTIADLDL